MPTLRESTEYQQFLKRLGLTTGWRLTSKRMIRNQLNECPLVAVYGRSLPFVLQSTFSGLEVLTVTRGADYATFQPGSAYALVREDLLAATGLAGTEAT